MIGGVTVAMTAVQKAAELMAHKHAMDAGWSPTAYLLLVAIIGAFATSIGAYIKVKPALDKISADKDVSLRQDLLQRIAALEESQRQNAERYSQAISSIKQEHAEEIVRVRHDMVEQHRVCEEENRSLRDQIAGLQRMMILWQMASGNAMPLSMTPEARHVIDKIVETLDLADEEKNSIVADILGGAK